ncbi:MAG: hypothetical protein ACOXZK_01495 [Bacteroidales bacterium]|jgi:hypothetical protein|nr:hypothetical protein [Bacteroidales bacterium]
METKEFKDINNSLIVMKSNEDTDENVKSSSNGVFVRKWKKGVLKICTYAALLAMIALIFHACDKNENSLNSSVNENTYEKSVDFPWGKITSFDLTKFVTYPDFPIGEFHNMYLDYLPTTNVFPNQTAYNQYELIHLILPREVRQQLDDANVTSEVVGDAVSIVLETKGFTKEYVLFISEVYPNVLSYFEKLQTHIDYDMADNFMSGDIDKTLNFFLELREQAVFELVDERDRNIMLGTLEIAAYSSVYWYNMLWTDTGKSPWHFLFIDEDDEVLKAPGPFIKWLIKAGKTVVKVVTTVGTDVACFSAGNFLAPGSGVPCAAAGSGVVVTALKEW